MIGLVHRKQTCRFACDILCFFQGSCRDCNERCCGYTQINLILYRLEAGGVPLVLDHQVLSPCRKIKDLKNVMFENFLRLAHQRKKI